VLVCYDFHFVIYDEGKYLMFVIEPKLFSIGTIVVPSPIKLKHSISLIPSISLNLVEQVPIVPIELIFVLLAHIAIRHDIFKQHLLEPLFQSKVWEMAIKKTPTCE
jgi:hypothetical protein